MISWIQNHLIRHGRWIFLTLLAVIIVAFVFTIGNTPGCTSNRSAYQEVHFYGYDLNSPREMEALSRKMGISIQLNRSRIQNDQQFQSQVTSRIAMLHLADQIGIPAPDQEALSEYIKTKPLFLDADGEFSRDSMTRFIDEIESDPTLGKGLVVSVLEEDYRVDQLAEALTGPGYLLPAEARAQTQRSQTKYKLATASIDYTNFQPEIEADEAALTAFYENNAARYEIAERIEASYIYFPAKNYVNQVGKASEAELRDHFVSNRARLVGEYEASKPMETTTTDADQEVEKPAVQFEDVRELAAASFNNEQASRLANEAAQAFAYMLYSKSVERDSAAFNTLLNEAGHSLKKIEPFTADGAYQRALPREMLESAFALSDAKYYSDPYPVNEGFGVLIFQGRIAPVLPPFEEVATAVRADYEAEEKRRLFNDEGERIKSELELELNAGTSFANAANKLELQLAEFEAFTVREAPRELNRAALQAAQNMKDNEISAMIRSGNSGIFVFLENKEIPEITTDNEDYTQAKDWLARYGSMTRRGSLLGELITDGTPESAE